MATLTTNKPIIIKEYIGTDKAFTYTNYEVGWKYITDFSTLDVSYRIFYYGKAFIDANGFVNIDITDVVKNHAFRHEYQYNQTQQMWIPENYNPATVLEPIENYNIFRTSLFVVKGSDEDWEQTVSITSLYFPEFYPEDEIPNAYNQFDGKIMSINYSNITPRIPMVHTRNYYIGIESIIGESGADPVNTLPIDGGNIGNLYITYVGYGNYSASYPLARFWMLFTGGTDISVIDAGGATPLDDVIDAGGAASAYPYIPVFGADLWYDSTVSMLKYGERNIAAVDNCPANYYVSWITPFGEWQSQPLQSVAVNETVENYNIETIRGIVRNVENKAVPTFLCRTGKLTNEEYKLFNTMAFSSYVLLYDVNKDKSYYCVFDSGSITVRDKAVNQRTFEFSLRKVKTNLQ